MVGMGSGETVEFDGRVTLAAFEACVIPLASWNHRAHLTVAYLLLRAWPLEEAIERMRRGVQRYNAAHGIEQTFEGGGSGYHETLTIAWMRVLHAVMGAYGAAADAEEFLDAHPHLGSRVMLRLYYTRERIMSAEARRGWVEPDLGRLPEWRGEIGTPGPTAG